MSETALSDRGTAYEEHKGYVLRVLAKRCPWIAPADRESLYHDAYALLLAKERADELDPDQMAGSQLRQYLVRTAVNKALDEGKSAERQRTEPLADDAFSRAEEGQPFEERAVAELDSAPVRELVAELPERQRAVIQLRFFLDFAPDEIQSFLGISSRAYRKELERAMRAIADRYELVREGRWCESRKSLVLAYVAGIAGPGKAAEARLHLGSCSACALWAAELREATERSAAFLPLPDVTVGDGVLTRALETVSSVKVQLADLATATKQQAAGIATRVDPSSAGYLGAARPGAVTAAVAGCVALGGGATYCVVEGVPSPLRPAAIAAKPDRERPERAPPRPEAAPEVSAPVSDAPQEAEAKAGPPQLEPQQVSPPASVPTPRPAKLAQSQPPAQQEFGFEGGGVRAPSSTQPAGSGSVPGPGTGASSGGGGEFGP